MVLCIVALVVFSVLGIFSVRYRRLAREAFECVFRTVMLRPCLTKFDEKIKSKIVARLVGRYGAIAKFVYKHFRMLSWIFTAAFFVSMAYSALVIYNLAVFGTCQPGSTSCVLTQDPVGKLIATLTCYEAQIAYFVILVAIVAALLVKKKKIVFV